MQIRAVVTGCPHSGTRYMAKVLAEARIPVLHETLINCSQALLRPNYFDIQAEVSWFAPGWFHKFPDDIMILHQVRDPIEVMNSLIARCVLQPSKSVNTYWLYEVSKSLGFQHIYDMSMPARAMLFWYHWNKIIENFGLPGNRYYHRYRIEYFSFSVTRAASYVLAWFPQCFDRFLLHMAMNKVPRDFPRVTDEKLVSITWSMLPDKVRGLAERYGYSD